MSTVVAASLNVEPATARKVLSYFKRFGFADEDTHYSEGVNGDGFLAAVQRFQGFYRLHGDSPALEKTLAVIDKPRCGLMDQAPSGAQISGCRWPEEKEVLVYQLGAVMPQIGRDRTRVAIEESVTIWNDVLKGLNITLQFSDNGPVVDVSFDWGDESDIPFIGTPIAHADFPPACGILGASLPRPVVFDKGRTWTDEDNPGEFDIKTVAIHEIGHILGLPHSPDENAVMFAGFPRLVKVPGPTDKANLKALYP